MIEETVGYIQNICDKKFELGIVLGSGLNGLVELLEDKIVIKYEDIPHFVKSTVKGHDGCLILGTYKGKNIIMMSGRFHYYQGYTMKEITYPILLMKKLGVEKLILTNACGGINESYVPGDIVLITDYLNLSYPNPLIGENDENLGPRFPDMSEPYCIEMIEKAKMIAHKEKIDVKTGVYALFCGPCYETKAEIRALKILGADLVGMSTVPETIMANYLGMKVIAFATVTNMATGIQKCKHSHERVVAMAQKAALTLTAWLEQFIQEI